MGMNDTLAPRRRGRPPVEAETVATDATEPTTRRRRAKIGEFAMKLGAPERPGFVRRWFNDHKNRIAEGEELAYDFVTDKGVKSTDPGSRISRIVGSGENGEPLRAYLMETPDEYYQEGLAEKEAKNRQVDDAIAAGRDSTGQHPDTHAGRGSIERDR
jgi:hypothetical protein